MKGNLSKKKGLLGEITNEGLEMIKDGVAEKLKSLLSGKVDKIDGKTLTSNDYTNEDKEKVDSIDVKEDKSNKTTTLSSDSTDIQYPSAKAVWKLVNGKEYTESVDEADIDKTTDAGLYHVYKNDDWSGSSVIDYYLFVILDLKNHSSMPYKQIKICYDGILWRESSGFGAGLNGASPTISWSDWKDISSDAIDIVLGDYYKRSEIDEKITEYATKEELKIVSLAVGATESVLREELNTAIAGKENISNKTNYINPDDTENTNDYPTVSAVVNYVNDVGGLFPVSNIPYDTNITISPNKVNNISTLQGSTTISLNNGIMLKDNEWCFVIEQGDTAYDIALPEIKWGLGIAPSFLANSITQCRLYFIGDVLCGEWVTV